MSPPGAPKRGRPVAVLVGAAGFIVLAVVAVGVMRHTTETLGRSVGRAVSGPLAHDEASAPIAVWRPIGSARPRVVVTICPGDEVRSLVLTHLRSQRVTFVRDAALAEPPVSGEITLTSGGPAYVGLGTQTFTPDEPAPGYKQTQTGPNARAILALDGVTVQVRTTRAEYHEKADLTKLRPGTALISGAVVPWGDQVVLHQVLQSLGTSCSHS